MAKAQSMVRGRRSPRFTKRGAFSLVIVMINLAFAGISACSTPIVQKSFTPVEAEYVPEIQEENARVIAHDGAALGLTVWHAETISQPDHVVVGVHGMNDYANAFHMAAPYWAARGVTTYAYDQRGFGRSAGRGRWPDEALMRKDLRTVSALVRDRHPEATITIVGISMGAAVALSTIGSERPPEADRLIASGPGLRGWGAMNPFYSASLWISAHTRPSWIVTPPRRLVRIEPSDNIEMLRRTWSDPLMTFENRIDQVYGVVSLMETAHKRVTRLPADMPVLITYGANDYVIPKAGIKRTSKRLPAHVRTAYYKDGYHMLMRDLQAETVHADYLAFMRAPAGPLPSGAPEWPWRKSQE